MKRIVTFIIIAVVVIVLVAYLMRQRPLDVETAVSAVGGIETFVWEEAETRLDDDQVVSMPVSGRLLRIDFKEGREVKKGEVIARIDTYERTEKFKTLESRIREIEALIVGVDKAKPKPEDIKAAELGVEEAEINQNVAAKKLDAARVDDEQEEKQFERSKSLLDAGLIGKNEYDEAYRKLTILKKNFDQAVLGEKAAAKALEQARVQLERLLKSMDDNEYQRDSYNAQIEQTRAAMAVVKDELAKSEIRAPVSGPILELYRDDEQVLAAGTPILKIGDLESIRIESDILSEEIGQVKVGQDVEISGPAVGPGPVMGSVDRIFPSGFEKISSLGIEQQRVKVIIAFDNSQLQLRPGVRVDARIITQRKNNTLVIPERALFKSSDEWHVFVAENGVARLRAVEVGLRNDEHAEITSGLSAGDKVLPSPPPELTDGMAVREKSSGT